MKEISGNIQRRVVVATLCSLVLVAAPVFASERESRAGSILTRITERLCEVQRALGNRLPTPLIDPARCLPTPPPPVAPTLKLVKIVVNDNGGTATTTDFQAKIDGGNVSWNIAQTLAVGSHTASEVTLAGYGASSWGGDCAANGTITLAAGENKTCTITNNDQAGRLIVDKVTVPSGSSAVFSITATGTGSIAGGGAGTTTDAVSKEYLVSAGTYSVVEVVLAGWAQASSTCTNVSVGIGETKTCTITNHRLPKLTVTKIVVNNNGGTATTTHFALFVDGATTTSGTQNSYATGTRMVSEGAHVGYTSTIGGDCAADGSITLAIGDVKSCTITNDDIAQTPTTATLTLVKNVVNDNGGTGTTTDFTLMLDGATVTSGVATTTSIGAHVISEGAHVGYSSTIGGDCATNGSITLAAGDAKTCTITNDDNAPQQTIGHMVISEVYYDVASTTASGSENFFEWVELYNGTAAAIDLQGWMIGDETSFDIISASSSVMIPSGGRAIIAASSTPVGIPDGVPVIVLHSSIGNNGFANSGDAARLLNAASTTVDAMGYGDNTTVSPNVSIPVTHDGHSLERVQLTSDTDTAADWADSAVPTPGS